jgi:hypothetical protein
MQQPSQRFTSPSEYPQVHIIERSTKPYWESGEGSFEDWSHDQSSGYHGKYF